MGRSADAVRAALIERVLRRELPSHALRELDPVLVPEATPKHVTGLITATPNE